MRPYRDIDYDALTDELAVTTERPYRRPSDFPSARAFIDFTTSPRPLELPRAARTAPGGACSSSHPRASSGAVPSSDESAASDGTRDGA